MDEEGDGTGEGKPAASQTKKLLHPCSISRSSSPPPPIPLGRRREFPPSSAKSCMPWWEVRPGRRRLLRPLSSILLVLLLGDHRPFEAPTKLRDTIRVRVRVRGLFSKIWAVQPCLSMRS